MSIICRIASIIRNRNVKIDKRTQLIEDASRPVVKISARNVTSSRKLSKVWNRAMQRHSKFDERTGPLKTKSNQ